MRKKDILVGIGSLLSVFICLSIIQKYQNRETFPQEKEVNPIVMEETVTYSGTLPCADCAGIETILRLSNTPGVNEGTFVLQENYLGKGTTETSGTWTTTIGNKKDPKATILVLTLEKELGLRNFLKTKDHQLILLDRERNGIPSKQTPLLTQQR